MGAQPVAQRRGHGHGDVIIRTRQPLGCAGVEPLLGLMGMTGRAGPVATAVIDMEVLATVITRVDMPAHRRRATGRDILEDAAMRRQEPLAKRLEIRRPELAEYVRDFERRHEEAPASIEQRNGKAGDGLVDLAADRLG